jgi:hypothetical protein
MSERRPPAPVASGVAAVVPAFVVGLVIGAAAVWMILSMRPKPAETKKEDDKTDLGPPFEENPIGKPVEKNHMQISAVWLPPIALDDKPKPENPHLIHIECDIKALAGNPQGFPEGAWVPYMTIEYTLDRIAKPVDPPFRQTGVMAAMVAKDGPHYGVSLEMPPHPSKYRLTFKFSPPSRQGFGRHADPVTGVSPWWEPFEESFEFEYPKK